MANDATKGSTTSDLASARADFTRKLLEARLLLGCSVPGVFGRGPIMRRITEGLESLIDEATRPDRPERVSFAPIIPRELLRKVGYMENFPQLCGSIHSFLGDDREHADLVARVKAGEDWSPHLRPTDVVLTPAACYPLYPTLAGTLPPGGVLYDLVSPCFRHEPSDDPARMQSFELRENVRAGTPADVQAWRASWIDRGHALLESLGLPVRADVASDPFFGRGGRLMKASQKDLELKFELLVPIWSTESPTAVASFNYHQEHFGHAFGIHTADGSCAHTACLGFGIDRIAIALLRVHGTDPERWPSAVREKVFR